MDRTTIATRLADWTVGLSFDRLPAAVVDTARESIRDVIANAAQGAVLDRMESFRSIAVSPGDNTVIARTERLSERDAAFLNAVHAHACELDDVIRGGGGHPGVSVVPAVLARAERLGAAGRDVITAIVAGYEVMHRVTAPIHPHHLERGFQGTGLGGPFGAAAAICNLTRLDANRTAHALAIAGSFATGLSEYDQTGGEVKRIYAGLAARGGLEVADLAAAGLTGPLTVLEGDRGLFRAFADECDPSVATDGLGEEFRILKRRVKRYPTVATLHASIDAVAALMEEPDWDTSRVRRVVLEVAPPTIAHGGSVRVPTDLVTAQFSLAYSIAVRMLWGRNDIDLYEDEHRWADARVKALAELVEVVADPTCVGPDRNRVRARVEYMDGSVRERLQLAPVGSPENPMTVDQLDARFEQLMSSAFDDRRIAAIGASIGGLEDLESVTGFVCGLAGRPDTSRRD